jgi:hypothetical protein
VRTTRLFQLHAPAQVTFWRVEPRPGKSLVWLWRRESNPHLPVYETDALRAVELHHKRETGWGGGIRTHAWPD